MKGKIDKGKLVVAIINGIFSLLCALVPVFTYNLGEEKVYKEMSQVINVDNGDVMSALTQLISDNKSLTEENKDLEVLNNSLQKKIEELETRPALDERVEKEDGISNKKNTIELKNLKIVNSEWCDIKEPFIDNYGNQYEYGLGFDAFLNAYSVYALKGEYKTFSATICACEKTRTDGTFSFAIYKDNELLEVFSGLTKEIETLQIGPYDITGARKLRIETKNEGCRGNNKCYITNAKLE